MSFKIMWNDHQKTTTTYTDPKDIEIQFKKFIWKKDRKGGYQDEIDEMFKKINS